MVKQYEVYLINLDPTIGKEIKKTRPCVIISPDEMNQHLETAIIAPLTSQVHHYPSRVSLIFSGKKGEIILDQIRSVDKIRFVKKLGKIDLAAQRKVKEVIFEMLVQ